MLFLLLVAFAFLDGQDGEEEGGGERAEGEEAARFCRPFPLSPLPAGARPTATVGVGDPCATHAVETAVQACFLPLGVAEGGEAGEAAEALRRGGSGEGGGGGGKEVVEEGEDLAILRWSIC